MLSRGDAPDMTVDELLENDEDDEYSLSEDDLEEAVTDTEGVSGGAEAMMALVVLSRMFHQGYLTAAEYDQRTEEVIEYAESEDGVDMP